MTSITAVHKAKRINAYKMRLIALFAGLICVILLLAESFSVFPPTVEATTKATLLLNDPLFSASKAEVKIVVWIPDADDSLAYSLLPVDWDWETRAANRGHSGFSAVSSRTIAKTEEGPLLAWYINLAATVKRYQGQVYLEERVHEGVDIQRFFTHSGAQPSQWIRSGATTSLSGYLPELGEGVQAGTDRVNLQVLTRMSKQGGETLLALPVLLTEF